MSSFGFCVSGTVCVTEIVVGMTGGTDVIQQGYGIYYYYDQDFALNNSQFESTLQQKK